MPDSTDSYADTPSNSRDAELLTLSRAFARIDAVALGIALGVISAIGLWGMTAALLIRGGELVGLHQNRLSFFLIGYDVSWVGAFIGALEVAAVGFGVGALTGWLWNTYHRMFVSIVMARQQRREIARELQGL